METRYLLWREDGLLMGAFTSESMRRVYLIEQKEMDNKQDKRHTYRLETTNLTGEAWSSPQSKTSATSTQNTTVGRI